MRTSASSSIVHILQGIQQKRSMSDNAMEDPKNHESLDGLRSYATCVKANKRLEEEQGPSFPMVNLKETVRKFFFAVWPCLEMDDLEFLIDDKKMDISTLEKFLQERIKVGGKPGALSDTVHYKKPDLFEKLQKKKTFSMMHKERRAATTGLSVSMYRHKNYKIGAVRLPGTKLRQAVEELLYIFGSAFVMENENSGCLVGCDESLIASVLC
ncbi:hypothetical protein YC2023_050308 [Brassica napus]